MNAHIISIGDEILIGQIINTNSVWMAQELNLIGVKVSEMITISDDKQAIEDAITNAFKQTDLILMTGGLGPTKDDITKKTIADLFGLELKFHEETYRHIENLLAKRGKTTSKAHKEQSFLPEKTKILKNKVGSAPGMWFSKNNKVLVAMPGVPYEMKYLMQNEVIPLIKASFPTEKIIHKTILTSGTGESKIAERISSIEDSLPSNIKLAYLPNLGEVRLRLSAFGTSETQLDEQIQIPFNQITTELSDIIYGYGTDNIETVIGRILKAQNKTIATAESCTGGYLANKITSVPGSSAYYEGSIITYSNQMKMQQLHVSPATIEQYGAVSEETVKEMLNGLIDMCHTDIGVSISGIAGPGGGTPTKPVGTIWVAVGNKSAFITKKLQLSKGRLQNIQYTTTYAMHMVRKFLLKNT